MSEIRKLDEKCERLETEITTLRTQLKSVEADSAVMREAVELVIDAYSFVSGGSREPISTAMKRPENEMNVFRLVISLNNLKKKFDDIQRRHLNPKPQDVK